MRKLSLLIALCLALCLAAQAESPRVILFSAYQQQGWGDRVRVTYLDRDGGMWSLEGSASGMKWPSLPEEQALYLAQAGDAEPLGSLSRDDLGDIKSLIDAVEDQGRSLRPGLTLDYGTTSLYAVRYDREGTPQCVLLYAFGDSAFANTDNNALALIRRMAGDEDPAALGLPTFQPVPISTFCGYDADALAGATLAAWDMDCEEGPLPVELDADQAGQIRALAQYGMVTGKANALEPSGGYTDYTFSDAEGNVLATISLYEGLLMCSDGMYYLDRTLAR